MIHLNDTNGASKHTLGVAERLLTEFDCDLIGAEFGIAYGGGVESIGKLWKDRGTIYGFDTFEGHPKEIGNVCEYSKEVGGENSFAAVCMDEWYKADKYGKGGLSYDYIRGELDRQELDNVILVKGLITDKTDLSFIKKLHYCFLDLDFPLSMWQAYNLIKGKIVKGGYLLLHDVLPVGHIHGLTEYYEKMKDGFEVIGEYQSEHLAILKKL